jgi:hypothetical protein
VRAIAYDEHWMDREQSCSLTQRRTPISRHPSAVSAPQRASQRGQLSKMRVTNVRVVLEHPPVDADDRFRMYQHNDNRGESTNNATSMIAILLAWGKDTE